MKASIHFTCAISSYATALYLMFGVNYLVHIVCSFLEYNFIKVVLDRSFVQKRTVIILLTFEIKHHLENSVACGSENASACMSRPDSQTSTLCVGVCRAAQCDRRTHSDAERTCPVVNSHCHTRSNKTAAPACRPPLGRQLRLAARPPTRSDIVHHENVNTLWTAECD